MRHIAIDRHMDILGSPTVEVTDIPLLAFASGHAASWECPSSASDGAVYVARTETDLVKVGFSAMPGQRVFTLGLHPEIFIMRCSMEHEKALHELFASELAAGFEYFRGAGIEAFIATGKARSRARARDWNSRDRRFPFGESARVERNWIAVKRGGSWHYGKMTGGRPAVSAPSSTLTPSQEESEVR